MLVVMFVFLTVDSNAFAQKFLKNYAVPLPDIKFFPQAEFEAATELHEGMPGGDVALSYKFRLPVGWESMGDSGAVGRYQISNKVLGEILRFYGPPVIDTRSYFSLQAINLEYKLTAQQWLLQFLLSNGYTIQGINEIDENRAEALYVKVEDSVTYVIRAVAQINGKRIVVAQYFMPADNWDDEKQMQAQVISTFSLTHPIVEPVEEMRKYHFLDIAQFQYPASWEIKYSPLTNIERMHFDLLNVASELEAEKNNKKTLNGRIQVDIASYEAVSSVEDELDALKSSLSKIGLVIGEKIDAPVNLKFADGVRFVNSSVYNAVDSDSNMLRYEYWITTVEAGDYYYFINLVTPSRDEEFFVWARNTETYKIILELFLPLEEGLVYR
jgi:hypothetical protein